MATVGENLRTFVLAIPAVVPYSIRMAQNIMQQGDTLPYVWYQRITEEVPICIDGSLQIETSRFTLEVVSEDINESITLANEIRSGLNGHFGTFGDQSVRGIQVEDKDDGYIARNDTDEGFHVTSLDVNIIQ